MVHVYPSSRAIRQQIERELLHDGLLEKYITISEFFSRITLHGGRSGVDDERRAMLLFEASKFDNFEKLHIERNFFTFLHNSNYIFRFFEELQTELVTLESLESSDIYGEYEEHIEILKELRESYKRVCEQERVDERIFYSDTYRLNSGYIKSLEAIRVYIDGYISNYELKLLLDIAKEIEVEIEFSASPYASKMIERFVQHGIVLNKGYRYKIGLHNRSATPVGKLQIGANIVCESVGERLLQVAFVKERIDSYIKKGFKPEEIVVIVPDESFANYLRLFDRLNNFNFAMGIPFTETLTYKRLSALVEYVETQSHQNRDRVHNIDIALIDAYQQKRGDRFNAAFFREFIEANSELCEKTEHKKALLEEYERFVYLFDLLDGMSNHMALKLFVSRLAKISLDDVGSGKITVMGLLESRQMRFKGVIVVDFNEDIVPRRSQKDLFINSKLRKMAKLPSRVDRENLQRHYYYQLFANAQEVGISYVNSQDKSASRFLNMLHITPQKRYSDEQYSSLLFSNATHTPLEDKEIEAPYDFCANTLSASALKLFLTCKRSFYYRYIAKLNGHEIPQELPKESVIGTYLHKALEMVYSKQSSYSSANKLRSDIIKALKEVSSDSILDQFLLLQWAERLEPFIASEIERFKKGVKVYKSEVRLETEVEGITLFGVVDRIDTHSGILEVIDYKSGAYKIDSAKTYEKSRDFQLEFYYLLASELGEVESCYYYDLNNAKLVKEGVLEQKVIRLKEILKALAKQKRYDFEKSESLADCRFCPYSTLCDRL